MSKLLVVIHAESLEQVLRNIVIAQDNDCDGCFLINHYGGTFDLLYWYTESRKLFPNWWIGFNNLDSDIYTEIDNCPVDLSGMWTDNLGIDENATNQSIPKQVWERKKQLKAPVLLFGGVAFKYQKEVKDFSKAASIASNYCDVVTTSGNATGIAPALNKIKSMKEAIGDKPLALASGASVENVSSFLPYVDYFLVASSISSSFTELDPIKTKELAKVIHQK